MFISGMKFDIEAVSDKILEHVEDLLTENTIIVDDYKSLGESFAKITALKKKMEVDTIDIVFMWESKNWAEGFDKDKYKQEIGEIHNRLNFKFTNSQKIPTYFRGAEANTLSFHFPAGFNIWFLTRKQFMESKVKPVIFLNFGVEGFQTYFDKYDDKIKSELKYYFIECNDYFSYEKHVVNTWKEE